MARTTKNPTLANISRPIASIIYSSAFIFKVNQSKSHRRINAIQKKAVTDAVTKNAL